MIYFTDAEADEFAKEYARLVKEGVPTKRTLPNGFDNPAYWQALAPIFSRKVWEAYEAKGGSLLRNALR